MMPQVKTIEKPTTLKMSYGEYLEWSHEDSRSEWVDGEVIIYMPAKRVHQTLVQFLVQMLSLYSQLYRLGIVLEAPFEVKLNAHLSREPDVLFVATKNLARLTEDRMIGAPDLVIEIVSRSSVRTDREQKFKEYEAAGVGEYWIIDPRPKKLRADFYHLGIDGEYILFGTEDDERIPSNVVSGFWLKPDWLWEAEKSNPLLRVLEICDLPLEEVVERLRSAENSNSQE